MTALNVGFMDPLRVILLNVKLLIEKSPLVPAWAMLLTTKYVARLPLHRFEKVLNRYGIELSSQTLA